MAMSTQPSRTVQTVSRAITRIAAWAVLLVLLSAVAVLVVVPKLVGGQALTVETGSMSPTLPVDRSWSSGRRILRRFASATLRRIALPTVPVL